VPEKPPAGSITRCRYGVNYWLPFPLEVIVASSAIVAHRGEALARPSNHSWYTYGPVSKVNVADFLKHFTSDPMNFNLQLEPIAEFLAITNVAPLQDWDVTVVSTKGGKAEPVDFAKLRVGPIVRRLARSQETSSLLVSGTKARVGQGGSESEGLSDDEVRSIKASFGKTNVPDHAYRVGRKRPLLLIFLLRGYELEGDKEVYFRPLDPPLIALGLSFPEFDDSRSL
jgi:hypothetical protein